MVQFEYKRFRMTATENDMGWKVAIEPREGGRVRETITCQEISDAIDEAKKIVNGNSKDGCH